MAEPLTESEKKMFEAIEKNDVTTLAGLLLEKRNVNIVDENAMTPLQHASYKGNEEMVQMLLDQGADVNLCQHQHGYTCLHFAGLSGNSKICLLLLMAGAKPNIQNTVNRTPAQMAAFVGNHSCVSTINTFIPPSEVAYYTEIHGQQTKPSLPNYIADSFHKFVMQINVFPMRIAISLQTFPGLIDHLDEVQNVLELLRDKEMKAKQFNEVIGFKLHYLSFIVSRLSKVNDQDKKSDLAERFARKCLKPGKDNTALPYLEEMLIESIRSFPYRESTLFRQMVTSIHGGGATCSSFAIINSAINGQRGFADTITLCSTCREEKPAKKCSKCKSVQYCDRNCQRLHWFAHKKECAKLAATEAAAESTNKKSDAAIDMLELQSEISQIISN